MAATQGIAPQSHLRPINHFTEDQYLPGVNRKTDWAHFPFVHTEEEFSWAEQVYHAGDIVALISTWENIPYHLQKSIDRLISEEYRKKLFTVPLYEASLLLLSSGILPDFRSLSEQSKQLYSDSCLEVERQKAIDFVSSRKPDDIVVMVLRAGRLIGTMTLFPFDKKQDIPSLSYLKVEPPNEQLPDAPAIEVGRLAKATFNGHHGEGQENDLTNTPGLAAAFILAKGFALTNGLLSDPNSFICGDTYGSFIASLRRFFPLSILKSRINPGMLEDSSEVRDMAMYFIQRQVLGSFESTDDLISAIDNIGNSNPQIANRIKELVKSELKLSGIEAIHKFDPKRFRVHFFYFPFFHPKTTCGFERLEKMMQRIATRPKRIWN